MEVGSNGHAARLAFTTDSYVVTPIFFPGGDIGRLAVNGTINDLAMSGARPLYLSAGFILEEGFPIEDLKRILSSMREAAARAGVSVVTGDTKVVQRGSADKIFINTAGLGIIESPMRLSATAGAGRRQSNPERHARRPRHDDYDSARRVGFRDGD